MVYTTLQCIVLLYNIEIVYLHDDPSIILALCFDCELAIAK